MIIQHEPLLNYDYKTGYISDLKGNNFNLSELQGFDKLEDGIECTLLNGSKIKMHVGVQEMHLTYTCIMLEGEDQP